MIPINKRGLVHITGRNDSPEDEKLGIHWRVEDPNGIVVEDYEGWAFGETDPTETHEFIGDRFDLNRSGTWTITISLSMNPSAPTTVDSYSGVLCVVGELKGSIVRKELEYDGDRLTIS